MRPSSELNADFAALYIEALVALGVTYFCIAPGSRSSPLVLALAENEQAETFVHFDERGLGFHALGAAAASRIPTGILVTTGTAVANLLPAIMEAHEDKIPLIILTADRPPELQRCGANQTCDQQEIFSQYCRFTTELPAPAPEISEHFISSTLSLAVHKALYPTPGPVHINCVFREPLIQNRSRIILPKTFKKKAPLEYAIPQEDKQEWEEILRSHRKGVIVLGSLPSTQDLSAVFALAEKLQMPILSDILSQGRCYGKHPNLIPFYDSLLKAYPFLKADCILHIGDRLVSNILQEWLSSHTDTPYLQLTTHSNRQDPCHQVTHQITNPIASFCQSLDLPDMPENASWLSSWRELSSQVTSILKEFFATSAFTGSKFFFELEQELPSHLGLFIGNSLPIRDAEHFFFPHEKRAPLFGQRGVSGIDGNIARIAGTAQKLEKKMVGIIGDQTFLHDINSLSQLSKLSYPVLLIVLNNCGGRIFSALPVQKKFPHLIDHFFAASHNYHFEHAAHLFHLPYLRATDRWKDILSYPDSAVLEIPIDPEEEKLCREQLGRELMGVMSTAR